MSIQSHHRFMVNYSRTLLFKIISRPAFLFLGGLTLSVMAFFSLLIHWVEGATNPHFADYMNAAYFTVSTMTSVGVAEALPASTAGTLISMAMMMLGTFLFVSFTGVVASTVLELELEIKQKD